MDGRQRSPLHLRGMNATTLLAKWTLAQAMSENMLERRWREYLEARDRAENSRDIKDGIAAGRAHARFLEEFEGPAARRWPRIRPAGYSPRERFFVQ